MSTTPPDLQHQLSEMLTSALADMEGECPSSPHPADGLHVVLAYRTGIFCYSWEDLEELSPWWKSRAAREVARLRYAMAKGMKPPPQDGDDPDDD